MLAFCSVCKIIKTEMSHQLFILKENIVQFEKCHADTAQKRLEKYIADFGKTDEEGLTVLEYAAIKNMDALELFIRMGISYKNFDMDVVYFLVKKLRNQLQENSQNKKPLQNGIRTSSLNRAEMRS